MDSKRFNDLTKALASGQSRRGVAKGLAAGFFGGLLGIKGRGSAEAARRRRGPGALCREHANCVDGTRCLDDYGTRRKTCTLCVDFFCQEECLNSCYHLNQTVSTNFAFNNGQSCEETCSQACYDPTCSFYFNQTITT